MLTNRPKQERLQCPLLKFKSNLLLVSWQISAFRFAEIGFQRGPSLRSVTCLQCENATQPQPLGLLGLHRFGNLPSRGDGVALRHEIATRTAKSPGGSVA
jgi:hypothetical protein